MFVWNQITICTDVKQVNYSYTYLNIFVMFSLESTELFTYRFKMFTIFSVEYYTVDKVWWIIYVWTVTFIQRTYRITSFYIYRINCHTKLYGNKLKIRELLCWSLRFSFFLFSWTVCALHVMCNVWIVIQTFTASNVKFMSGEHTASEDLYSELESDCPDICPTFPQFWPKFH